MHMAESRGCHNLIPTMMQCTVVCMYIMIPILPAMSNWTFRKCEGRFVPNMLAYYLSSKRTFNSTVGSMGSSAL